MPEVNTQTNTQSQAQLNDLGSGIVVKDVDGNMKVLSDGELKELDSMLSDSQVSDTPAANDLQPAETRALVPTFTDNAPVPEQDDFKEPEKSGEVKGEEVAEMHFHSEDKADLEAELKKIQHVYDVDAQKKYDIGKIVAKLADKHELQMSEGQFQQFSSTMLSFFRQARNKIDTLSKLTEKESGGLGIDPNKAEHIVAIASNLKDKIEQHDGVVVDSAKKTPAQSVPLTPPSQPTPQPQAAPKPAPPAQPKPVAQTPPATPAPALTEETQAPPVEHKRGKRPMMPLPSSAMPQVSNEKEEEEKPEPVAVPEQDPNAESEAVPEEPITPMESAQATSQPSSPAMQVQPEPKKEETSPLIKPVTEAPATSSIPKVSRPTKGGKMQDVKAKRSKSGLLTGRIDELAQMDLETWRLLDPNPRIRAGKILGKIQNLQQESYLRRSQGLDAWKGSETYQHYLRLGQMSLEQGKDISQVIKEIKDGGEETLTLDEFEAISDLNRTLRF